MCPFQILSQHADGYVIYCQDCNAIQLAFGTSLVKMEAAALARLEGVIRVETEYRALVEADNIKNVIIPLSDDLSLCLTAREFRRLEAMAHEAAALLETYQLLDLM